MATHVSDYTKTSPEIVLDLINADNSSAVTAQQIAMAAPVAGGGLATSLKIKGKPIYGTKGSTTVSYNRVAINAVPGINNVIDMEGATSATMLDIVAKVNASLGINMTAEDIKIDGVEITEESINLPEGEIVDAVFMAKPTSLVWFGTSNVRLIRAMISIDPLVTVTSLNGLYRAEEVPSITYGLAQKDYVVQNQYTYDETYAQWFNYGEILNRPYNTVPGYIVHCIRHWISGEESFGYVVGKPKTEGDLSETPFSVVGMLKFQEELDRAFPNTYKVTEHAFFLALETRCIMLCKRIDDGTHDAVTLTWSINNNGETSVWVHSTYVVHTTSIDNVLTTMAGEGGLVTREQAGNLYEYIFYKLDSSGLIQSSVFMDSRKFIGNFGIAQAWGGDPVLVFRMESGANAWGVSVGRANMGGYQEFGSFDILPEGYPNPETLTRGISAIYPAIGYNQYNYMIMTWNTPDGDCVVKAVEVQNGYEDETAFYSKSGYIESVRNTCGLQGDMEASLIHCTTTIQRNAIYAIVHPKCRGRPGIPGNGALTLYNSLHTSDLAEIFYGFKPAGDTIAMQWTQTGAMRDHEFGQSLISLYTDDENNFHIYHAARGQLKATIFWPELTPRPGLKGAPLPGRTIMQPRLG